MCVCVCVLHKGNRKIHLLPMQPQRRLVPGLAAITTLAASAEDGPDMSTMVRRGAVKRREPSRSRMAHPDLLVFRQDSNPRLWPYDHRVTQLLI